MRHPPQSRWQQKVFEDVLKERLIRIVNGVSKLMTR